MNINGKILPDSSSSNNLLLLKSNNTILKERLSFKLSLRKQNLNKYYKERSDQMNMLIKESMINEQLDSLNVSFIEIIPNEISFRCFLNDMNIKEQSTIHDIKVNNNLEDNENTLILELDKNKIDNKTLELSNKIYKSKYYIGKVNIINNKINTNSSTNSNKDSISNNTDLLSTSTLDNKDFISIKSQYYDDCSLLFNYFTEALVNMYKSNSISEETCILIIVFTQLENKVIKDFISHKLNFSLEDSSNSKNATYSNSKQSFLDLLIFVLNANNSFYLLRILFKQVYLFFENESFFKTLNNSNTEYITQGVITLFNSINEIFYQSFLSDLNFKENEYYNSIINNTIKEKFIISLNNHNSNLRDNNTSNSKHNKDMHDDEILNKSIKAFTVSYNKKLFFDINNYCLTLLGNIISLDCLVKSSHTDFIIDIINCSLITNYIEYVYIDYFSQDSKKEISLNKRTFIIKSENIPLQSSLWVLSCLLDVANRNSLQLILKKDFISNILCKAILIVFQMYLRNNDAKTNINNSSKNKNMITNTGCFHYSLLDIFSFLNSISNYNLKESIKEIISESSINSKNSNIAISEEEISNHPIYIEAKSLLNSLQLTINKYLIETNFINYIYNDGSKDYYRIKCTFTIIIYYIEYFPIYLYYNKNQKPYTINNNDSINEICSRISKSNYNSLLENNNIVKNKEIFILNQFILSYIEYKDFTQLSVCCVKDLISQSKVYFTKSILDNGLVNYLTYVFETNKVDLITSSCSIINFLLESWMNEKEIVLRLFMKADFLDYFFNTLKQYYDMRYTTSICNKYLTEMVITLIYLNEACSNNLDMMLSVCLEREEDDKGNQISQTILAYYLNLYFKYDIEEICETMKDEDGLHYYNMILMFFKSYVD